MKYKMITFGLLLSLLMLCEAQSNCNYLQNLEPGKKYYAYNPNYNNTDKGEKDCTWQARSSYLIKIDCNFEIPTANRTYCTGGSLLVTFAGRKKDMYCGNGKFTDEGTHMTINFKLPYETTGKFLCEIETEEPDTFNCNCGYKNPQRIVGGSNTGVHEYPMMAGLIDSTIGTIICGATIISKRYALTAAHCLKDRKINNVGVVVGEHDVSTGKDTGMTKLYRISKIIIHPGYDNRYNDIGICKTTPPMTFSFAVSPACLPFKHQTYSFAGLPVMLLGWGLIEFGGAKSDVLKKVDVKVITNAQCERSYPVSPNDLCTYTQKKDACQMDSGGPVIWEDSSTDKLVLIGIITGGSGCGENIPSLNTRVGNYLKWLLDITGGRYCLTE